MKRYVWAAALAVLGSVSGSRAEAGVVTLDLTSGVRTTEMNTATSYQDFDTYREDGFTLQVEATGNHMDSGYANGILWHDGPANEVADNQIRLTFGGAAFDLTQVQLANFGPGIVLTGSNGATATVAANGALTNVSGFTNVTFVSISIDAPAGTGGSTYLDTLVVNNTPSGSAVPEPASMSLLALGAVGMGAYRLRLRRRTAAEGETVA